MARMARKMMTNRVLFTSLGILTVLGLLVPSISLKQLIQPSVAANALSVSATTTSPEAGVSKKQAINHYEKLPLTFEVNRGQTDSEVKFMSRGSEYNLYLTPSEAVLTLRKGKAKAKVSKNQPARGGVAADLDPRSRLEKQRTPSEKATVRMKFVGASAKEPEGFEQQSGSVNYFLGNDPKKWLTDVPTFRRVQYRDIYRGVDLIYYGQQRRLEYDFIVKPGADPNQIRLRFSGVQRIRIDDSGGLVLTTRNGTVNQRRPEVYQDVAGSRTEISGRYVVRANQEVSFEIGSYDVSKPLVIDPVLDYSTYLGGSDGDYCEDIAVDTAGNAYLTGLTGSTDFPTLNAFQANNQGLSDGFVTKLTPTGALSYSSYFGGSDGDWGSDIAVDLAGNAYVTGQTSSGNFPTLNAQQVSLGNIYDGGLSDAFVTKLSPTGGLSYSTYLGGNSYDGGRGIAVDSAGNAYVTGFANSSNFPRLNAYQNSHVVGGADAFVTKLTASGALSYSTYLGGNGDDYGNGIAVDAANNAYLVGYTAGNSSNSFPRLNAYQTVFGGGGNDAFVAKLAPSGGLSYSTFLGGSLTDYGWGIDVSSDGSAYVTGLTYSNNFPTLNAYQGSHAPDGESGDVFVTKLTVSGGLDYSTFLGGSGDDWGFAIATDSEGNAYVTGQTSSSNFPTLNPTQGSHAGGFYDAFVTKLTGSGGLSFSTYLGGNNVDKALGIAADSAGTVYVTGFTQSTNFPTVNALQTTRGGPYDAFVTKIITASVPDVTPPIISCPADVSIATDSGQCFANINPGSAMASDDIDGDVTPVPTRSDTQLLTAPYPVGTTTITWTARDQSDNEASCVQTITVNDSQNPTITPPPDRIVFTGPAATSCAVIVSDTTLGESSASDNCGSVTISRSGVPAGNNFPVGLTTITYTATDGSDHSAVATQRVTVIDDTPPAIVCPSNVSVTCSPDFLVPVTYPAATATDACDAAAGITYSKASGTGFQVGTTLVTATATDAAGNHSSCSFTVTRMPLSFNGFHSPLGGADATGGSFSNPLKTFKMNSTIPLKFSTSCAGSPVVAGIHTLQAIKWTNATDFTPPIDATPQDAATVGNQFRLTDGDWHFNLDTGATGMSTGKWQLIVTLSDGSQHSVWIQIK